MGERQTTLVGLAAESAVRNPAARRRISGKPGAGSKLEGSNTKTPSAPVKAVLRAGTLPISAKATSQPCADHSAPLAASRTTARTDFPALRRARAAAPPT